LIHSLKWIQSNKVRRAGPFDWDRPQGFPACPAAPPFFLEESGESAPGASILIPHGAGGNRQAESPETGIVDGPRRAASLG